MIHNEYIFLFFKIVTFYKNKIQYKIVQCVIHKNGEYFEIEF